MYLLCISSDIVNLLLTANAGRARKPNFVIFVGVPELSVGGWLREAESLV